MGSPTSSFSLGLEANSVRVGGAELIGLVDHAVRRVGGQLHLLLKQEHEVSDPWLLVSIGSRKLTVTWTTPPAPRPVQRTEPQRDQGAYRRQGTNGQFFNETDQRLGGNAMHQFFGTAVELHDFDGDGKLDILRLITPAAEVIRNMGDPGNFAAPDGPHHVKLEPPDEIPPVAYMATAGDLDGDGWLDVYVVTDVLDFVKLGLPGSISFTDGPLPTSLRTSEQNGNVKMFDIDGDGDLDVATADVDVSFVDSCNVCQIGGVCSYGGGACTFPQHSQCPEDNVNGPRETFALLRNNALHSAVLEDPWPIAAPQPFHLKTHDFAFLDLNGDGCPDLLLGLCNGYKVFIQNCPSTGSAG